MNYNKFKTKYLGKKVDYDSAYGAQCVDLARQYIKEVLDTIAQPPAVNGAKDFWNKDWGPEFEKLANTPTFLPKEGDIVIFDSTSSNPYGHIGIVDSANLTILKVLEQNVPNGGAVRVGNYNYITPRVLGFFRKKEKANNINSGEIKKKIDEIRNSLDEIENMI